MVYLYVIASLCGLSYTLHPLVCSRVYIYTIYMLSVWIFLLLIVVYLNVSVICCQSQYMQSSGMFELWCLELLECFLCDAKAYLDVWTFDGIRAYWDAYTIHGIQTTRYLHNGMWSIGILYNDIWPTGMFLTASA